MLVVLTTTPGFSEGALLAERIVKAKLAACVQIIPQITSVYIWNGEVQKGNEQLLLIKTTDENYHAVEQFIKDNHSYDVPEIVAVRSENASEAYRAWLEAAVNGQR